MDSNNHPAATSTVKQIIIKRVPALWFPDGNLLIGGVLFRVYSGILAARSPRWVVLCDAWAEKSNEEDAETLGRLPRAVSGRPGGGHNVFCEGDAWARAGGMWAITISDPRVWWYDIRVAGRGASVARSRDGRHVAASSGTLSRIATIRRAKEASSGKSHFGLDSSAISRVLEQFSENRHDDVTAMSDLSMNSHYNLRRGFATLSYVIKKYIDNILYARSAKGAGKLTLSDLKEKIYGPPPSGWMPLYTMVSFRPDISYATAKRKAASQERLMDRAGMTIGLLAAGYALRVLSSQFGLGPQSVISAIA
ncbi:hypothetical protein C8R45DRAFT_1136901 [Mycena sanguinolenta]|nr:hypothetical protein C8R45DRAFT_1136901 [Mycena sanguinolenta]